MWRMTKLDDFKKEKREEFERILRDRFNVKSSGLTNDTLGDIDQLISDTVALVEREVVPGEMTMEAALKAGSDAGAGYTIGHNSCRNETLAAFVTLRGDNKNV